MQVYRLSIMVAMLASTAKSLQVTKERHTLAMDGSSAKANLSSGGYSEWDESPTLPCIDLATSCEGSCVHDQADLCKTGIDMNFNTVKYNNIAGLGPNTNDPPVLRWSNVGSVEGQAFDVIAEDMDGSWAATKGETCGDSQNGWCTYGYTSDRFAREAHEVKKDQGVGNFAIFKIGKYKIQFKFVKAGTDIEMVIPTFSLVFYDIDGGGATVGSHEYLSTCDASSVILNTPTKIQGGCEDNGCCKHWGPAYDVGTPSNFASLTADQKGASPTYIFKGKSSVVMDLEITLDGRWFLFKGTHELACDKTCSNTAAPTPAPTPIPTEPCVTGTCTIAEDPHVEVFDGAQVSLIQSTSADHSLADAAEVSRLKGSQESHASSDMWLVKSGRVSIQARLTEDRLFVRAVAIGGTLMKGNVMVIGSLQDSITWNGISILQNASSSFELQEDSEYFVKAVRTQDSSLVQDLSVKNRGVKVDLPMNVSLIFNRLPGHVNVAITMPPQEGGQEGLCGNFNGLAADDSVEFSSSRVNLNVPVAESLLAGLSFP